MRQVLAAYLLRLRWLNIQLFLTTAHEIDNLQKSPSRVHFLTRKAQQDGIKIQAMIFDNAYDKKRQIDQESNWKILE